MKAFKSSVDGLEHAVDLDYQKDYYTGEREYSYENGNLVLNSVKGESKNKNIKVEGIIENGVGTVSVDKDGNTSLIIYNDEYCAVKDFTDKTITVEEKTERNCMIPKTAYCFETEEITAVESYDINLENCKTFIDSESNSLYDDENLTLFCTKGQTASDGFSMELLISGNQYTAEELETEQVIENVVYSEGLSITDYKCYEGNEFGYETITDVVIPSKINGKSIIKIGEEAFFSNGLTSVIIPNSVATIGTAAFRWNDLTSVTLGNNIKIIEDHAFYDNNLETIFIPRSTEIIGDYAFGCNNLSESDVTYEDPNNLPLVSDKVFKCGDY